VQTFGNGVIVVQRLVVRIRTRSAVSALVLAVLAGSVVLAGAPAVAGTPGPRYGGAAALGAAAGIVGRGPAGAALRGHRPHQSGSCAFDGTTGTVITVSPGATVTVACTGFPEDDLVYSAEGSPLFLTSNNVDDLDLADQQTFTTDSTGALNGNFVVPDPFSAVDPSAACPPTPAQVTAGYLRCFIELADVNGPLALVPLDYSTSTAPPPPTPPPAIFTGMAATPDGLGYWLVKSDGTVITDGDAVGYGSMAGQTLNAPISHIVPTPDGRGYWLVASDGGTFAFGDAGFYGSMGGKTLNAPVVDIAPTHDGKGYWLVASDGGIFAFGDAAFLGSMGGKPLNEPVVGIVPDYATGGYWEVASDGGIFSFGAPFFGSTGSIHLNDPVNGMASTPDDQGYWFVASDGGIFAYGDANFWGSTGSMTLNAPIVDMATDPVTGGYWLVGSDGGVFAFHAPFFGSG
jgi:hypothetical protein